MTSEDFSYKPANIYLNFELDGVQDPTHSISRMAHLLVTSETVITDQTEQENRSMGKHKRGGDVGGLTCHEASVWPDNTKRRALVSITNQPNRILTTNSTKSFSDAIQRKLTEFSTKPNIPTSSLPQTSIQQLKLDDLQDSSSSFLSCDEEIKPIGSELNVSSGNESRMSLSIAMSSFRSISFDSPMLVSSPDVFASKFQSKEEFVDIDLVENSSSGSTGEYASDIFSYLREAEVRFHPNPQYMKKQPDITDAMRCILIDWLVEVAEEFKLDQQTLYMSISIVDRFLSNMSILRSKLQLLGATAMYIASKFEEILPPELADFTYITDDTYTKSQIVRMERLVLKILDFNLAAPTAHTFVLRYLKASEVDLSSTKPNQGLFLSGENTGVMSQAISALSMYLCELALQDADPYLKYHPSVIAASAVCLARHSTGQTAWPRIMEHYSGYTVSDVGNCVQDLHRTLALAPHHAQQAIRNKYSSHVYHTISTMKAPETLPC